MVLKSILPSVRDPFSGEGRVRGAVVGGRSQWFFLQGTALWPCHSSPPAEMASHHLCGRTALVGGRVIPLLSGSPGATAPRHSLLTPVAALSFPRNSQELHGDRKPFTLSKNPGLKMQWPQPLLLCQISGTENNCEQFNSLDLASLALPVKVSNAHRAPHLHTQPAFLLGRRHAGIAEKLGSPGPAAQKGLGGRTRNLLANSRTDFLCESRRQGLHPGQAAPAPRTVLG